MMNIVDRGSIRALMLKYVNGIPWGSWRGSIRYVDYTHVSTTFGIYSVEVDNDIVWLRNDSKISYSISYFDYSRLVEKHVHD